MKLFTTGKKYFTPATICVLTLLLIVTTSLRCYAAITISGPDQPTSGSQYTATGGVAPYTWCISKGSITPNGFVTVFGLCGTATIMAADSCGNSATKVVKMSSGAWYQTGAYYPGPSAQGGGCSNCCWQGRGTLHSAGGTTSCSSIPTGTSATTATVTHWNLDCGQSPTKVIPFQTCMDCSGLSLNSYSSTVIEYAWKCPNGSSGTETACVPPPPTPLTVNNPAASVPSIENGESVTFSATLSRSAGWTVSIAGRTIGSGSGTAISATWNGTNADGSLAAPGAYTATIAASTCSGSCTDSQTVSVTVECDLALTNPTATPTEFNPSAGGSTVVSATVTSALPYTWTVTVAGRTFTGSGPLAVAWDGKDGSGTVVPDGVYAVDITASSNDGGCAKTASTQVTVQSCDLKANLTGPGGSGVPSLVSTLPFGTGYTYPITGSYTTSSTQPVNWTLTLPNGKTESGTDKKEIGAVWDGTLSNGTLAPAGPYQATLTVASSNSTCSNTATLPITVSPAPGNQCGFIVTFGSSAHVANGNLSHTQELFSASGGAQPLGLGLYYNSRDSHSASLGRGWSHSYDASLKENSDGSVLISEPDWKYQYYTLQNGAYIGQPGNYSTLAKKVDGTFTLASRGGQVSTFTSTGKLTSISDRNGNTLNLAYSGDNLSSVTDPAGRTVSFAYDGDNHLTTVADPTGNIYTFSVAGNSLSTGAQPDGSAWQYTYDVNAFMLTKTDPLGNITTYAYDDRHRVVSSIDPEGRTRSITYPQTSDTVKSTTFTEKDGGVWQYSYDTQKGTLNSKTDPQGGVTSYTYDAAGNRTSTTNPDGTTTTATYDSTGNMLTSTDALGQTTGYAYNAFGQITSITDSQGGTTGYVYDAKGNMTSLTDQAGATTTYAYDAKGNVTKVTNAAGQATIFTFDANGNLASITDPAGAVTTYAYDTAGNMTSITDTKGAVTQFVYDSRNRLIKTIDPQGNAALFSYDANGNKLSETDANSNTTTFEYNSRNQLIKTRDALGSVTTYAYGGSTCPSCGGGADKLTAITDVNGNITSYLYDQLGRSVKEADPLGNSTVYAYDARNNPVSKTDANGDTINYSYDANGRLLKKSYPDGTEETFTYDAKGNLLTVANKNISYTFGYDAAGRMLSTADSTGKVISYEYDLLGNKTKMISPEGKSLTYIYDSANRLTSIINGGAFTFGYDTKGQRTSLTYPNGDTATYGYDKQGRLTSLVRKNAAGNIISSNSYTLDKIGNRQTNTTQDGTSSYSYDNIYRLLQTITNTPGYSANTKATKGTANAVQQQKDYFIYDPVGNRLTSANNRSYSYGPGNQLISENGTTYSYDRNGNLIRKSTAIETTTYVWDFENRLSKVVTPFLTSEYAYDPFGRRIEKKVTESGASTTTKYFYDNQAILFDYDENGAIGNRYLHGPNIDETLAVSTGKDKYYYHADGLGSIIALTDQSGKVVQTNEYDSFGNLKDQKNRVKQPFTYTGREWDKETGLYYYRARYYDPMEGRFVSKDPIGFKGGINIYAYVQNNPINKTDPLGLFDWVNPITYWTDLYNYARETRIWGHNQYPCEENTSMRHCVVSCMVASNFGTAAARTAGVGNEAQGFFLHDIPNLGGRISGDQPWAFQLQDLRDNERGFRCSERNRNSDGKEGLRGRS